MFPIVITHLEVKWQWWRGVAVKLVLVHAVLTAVGVAGSAEGKQRTN